MHTLPISLTTSQRGSLGNRSVWMIVALVVAVGYFYLHFTYWAPASPLIDQNAYEMGGKRYAEALTTGVKPPNDFTFISAMYVRAEDGTYYPKYPLGLPMLYAVAHWVAGGMGLNGIEASFLVAPISAAASVLGVYFLLSRVTGGFVALMGALLLGFSPLVLVLGNQHWSHHPSMAVNVWGMFFLVLWWQKSRWWWGLIAGLLIGFAVLIRYTDGLLVLPLAFVVLMKMPWRGRREIFWPRLLLWMVLGVIGVILVYALGEMINGRVWMIAAGVGAINLIILHFWRTADENRWVGLCKALIGTVLLVAMVWLGWKGESFTPAGKILATIGIKAFLASLAVILFALNWQPVGRLIRSQIPMMGWALPVGYLVMFNRLAMGSWTGYDTTNESTGFSLSQLGTNWEYVIKHLNITATMFILPVALLGLGMIYQRNWRFGMFLALWLLPGVVVYGAYYWGTDTPIIPIIFYMRFFIASLPAIVCCAALLLGLLIDMGEDKSADAVGWAAGIKPVAVVIVGGVAVVAGLHLLAALRLDLSVLIGSVAGVVTMGVIVRGRGIVAPVVTGGLVALSAGVSLEDSIGSLERDFAINANLCESGRIVVERIGVADMKKTPLLFTEQIGLIHHLQVVGDFECYSRDAFDKRAMFRQSGQREARSTPDPMQGARGNYTAGIYAGKSEADLTKIQNDLISQGLKEGRRVFIVLSRGSYRPFVKRFITPEMFAVKNVYTWKDSVEMSDGGRKAMMNLGLVGQLMLGSTTPQHWTMAEVVLK